MVARSGHGRVPTGHDAAHHLTLLQWAATLLPPTEGARAIAELSATNLAAAAALRLPVERDGSNESDVFAAEHLPGEQLAPGLRAARSVEDCDALLDAAPVEWNAMAAAHAREPFGRTPARALVARRDCPDALTAALLTPWHPRVADRLAARQKDRPRGIRSPVHWYPHLPDRPYELPDTLRHVLLPHLSQLRSPLLRLLLTADRTHEVVRATTRLDRLVAAVDRCDRDHVEKMYAFWDAVGVQLRDALGENRKAWTTAAERLPSHRGSLRDLLDGLDEPVPGSRRRTPDLRVLVQAPPKVLAAIVADLDDDARDRAAAAWTRPGGVRWGSGLLATVLSRLGQAGVPPRRLFARWASTYLASWDRTFAGAGWLYGLDEKLDESLVRLARTHADLRRELAAGQPRRAPAADLVAELRGNPGPVQVQLVLDSSCSEDTPWTQLVEAHTAEPLPDPVLWVLAARPGFPATLAPAVTADQLGDLAAQGPDAARAVFAELPGPVASRDGWRTQPVVHKVRSEGVLDDPTVLATARPAGAVLRYGCELSPAAPGRAAWNAACAQLFTDAAHRTGPGFWRLLAGRLPTFQGTLTELLAQAVTSRRP